MSFEIQNQIKNNAQDIKQYVNDLYDWQQQISLQQQAKKKMKNNNNNPFEQKVIKHDIPKQNNSTKQVKQVKKELIRDANTVSEYYKAWDSFNVDQELDKLERQQERKYKPYNPYENNKNNIRAKPKAQMTIKGGRQTVKDPTSLKDKGNLHYKVCEFEKAIQCYSKCLERLTEEEDNEENRKIKSLVFSNRAMAYMKINERAKALQDCNSSISNDPRYSKSYLRRADCFRKMGRFKQALLDYEILKELTPDDKDILIEIKNLQAILQKRVKQAANNLIVNEIPQVLLDSFRIPIQEIQSMDLSNSKQQSQNYLEQL